MPLKRIFDLAIALSLYALLLPVIATVALIVRWRLGSPVLFRQARAGQDGQPFTLVKFRTMTDERTPDGKLLPDEYRLTRLGRLLRTTTLDELPSLWNVVRGDLSLVGPRPLYCDYVPLYSPRQLRRLEVKPGLTGWAVVQGRNKLGWDERFELDVWYVENRSFWLDLKILIMTAWKVVKRSDVNQEGYATMPRFQGPNGSSES